MLKWSVSEHFKEYLAYAPFTVHTDNNLLTTPNLDAMGHCWVGALASYEFTLEYQKRSDNAAAEALSRVPVRHDKDTVQSLLEGAVTSTAERGEALVSQTLRVEHDHLSEESQACSLKLAPIHVTNWAEAGQGLIVGCLPEMDVHKKGCYSAKERCIA